MERKRLIGINGKIFVGQWQGGSSLRCQDVRILVVGNPCNTNCLVANTMGGIFRTNVGTAMTRLDHNRARNLWPRKRASPTKMSLKSPSGAITSNTQYPDFTNAKIKGPTRHGKSSRSEFGGEHVRAAYVRIEARPSSKARGSSSALSAANGALDHVKSLLQPTPANDWISAAVISKGQYAVPPPRLQLPQPSATAKAISPSSKAKLDPFGQQKFQAT